MTDVKGQERIAALEAELARVQSERALMDARMRAGQLDAPAPSRRADVLAWGAFFVAAALVTSLLVTIAQQSPRVVREHTRVETVVVPEAPAPVTAGAEPVAISGDAAPPSTRRPNREREARPATHSTMDLLGEDRCGNDPTCGI